MQVVITGALGHIGSRLMRQLPVAFEGARIVLIDNLHTQRYCSLFGLPSRGDYQFIQADVLTMDLAPVFDGADAVIHLAAITDAAGSFQMQKQVEEVNIEGTRRVAEACARTGTNLVFLSTTSVYGTQRDRVDESCSRDELKPQSPYAESKLRAEELLASMRVSTGLRHVTCRFGTIFGVSAGMRFHTAINKFCWQAANGLPLTIWRTALDQRRPYLELGDAVRAICFLLTQQLFDGSVYNVLTLNASVRNLVDIITAHVPETSIEFVDTEIMNQLSYDVSNERFADRGFRVEGELETGIVETLELLRPLRGLPGASNPACG